LGDRPIPANSGQFLPDGYAQQTSALCAKAVVQRKAKRADNDLWKRTALPAVNSNFLLDEAANAAEKTLTV
jgi:hypothetical protein